MSRRKRLLILCVAAILLLGLIPGLELVRIELARLNGFSLPGQSVRQEEEISYAADYEQLQLYIEYPGITEQVNVWNTEDCFYFFLPANTGGQSIFFGNLQEGDSIRIGEDTYRFGEEISEEIQLDTPYEMQLCISGSLLETKQLVFMRSANLPAMFLDMASGSLDNVHEDKEIKEAASMTLVDESGRCQYHKELEYIKARGNSTFFEVEKKSYQIKLADKNALLGMEEAKKWLLLAHAKDASLIRNKLVFDYASRYTDVPSIDGEYVDLYVNGDYIGTYFLCEKVEVLAGRLSIADLDKKNEAVNTKTQLENSVQYVSADGKIRALSGIHNPDDITGGYLLEKIGPDEYEVARTAFLTDSGNYFAVVSPEHATIEQVEYICGLFNELESAVKHPDGINPTTGKHFSEYLDMDSWTSKYLMEEAFSDPDVPEGSVYFYKDSDAVDPLIYSGPMWDYDRTMGAYAVGRYYVDDPLQMGYRAVYAEELLRHEEVMATVREKYEEVFLPYVRLNAALEVDTLQKKLRESAAMNFTRWPEVIGYYEAWDANSEFIMDFLEARKDYLSDVWLGGEAYHTVTFLDYNGRLCDKYMVKHGEYLPAVPTIASHVAVFNGWVSATSGNPLDIRLPILEDAEYQSEWIDVGLILQNGVARADTNIESINIEGIEALVEEIKRVRGEEHYSEKENAEKENP